MNISVNKIITSIEPVNNLRATESILMILWTRYATEMIRIENNTTTGSTK